MKPVFVYGSLREGFYNYRRCLQGKVEKMIPATLKGFEMYSVGGSYPAMIPATQNDVVVGELMILDESKYESTMRGLDSLEGYSEKNKKGSLYLREVREVQLETGEFVEAYVYVWNRSTHSLTPVPGGDWKEHKMEASV